MPDDHLPVPIGMLLGATGILALVEELGEAVGSTEFSCADLRSFELAVRDLHALVMRKLGPA